VKRRIPPVVLAALAVAALCLASFAGALMRPGLIGHTWDWGVPSFYGQFKAMADHHFSTWDAYFETGRYHYFKLELLYWQLITPFSVIGGEAMSKLLPLLFVTASGLAMLPLARRLGLSWFYATLSAVLYALSPYTFSRVAAGHMPMLAGYAIIPLLLLAFFALMDAIRERGRMRAWLVIVCGLLLGLTSMHPSVGVGSVVMLTLLALHRFIPGPGRARVAAGLCMIFTLAMLMNVHYMAPFLGDYLGKGAIRHGWGLSASAKGDVTVDTELPMREGFHQSTSQPVDAAVRLDLRPGMDTEYVYPAPAGMRAPWTAASLVLAGLSLCSFMARRGRPETGGLFLVAVTGILLVCGSRTPFGYAFYQWLLKGAAPILFAAFSNTTRWLPLIVTAYALLAFQLPQWWEERGLARPWLVRGIMLAVTLAFVSPYLGQKLLDNSPRDKVPQPLALKHTPIHPEDAKVYSFLAAQRREYRVAYLPPVGISWPGDSPYGYEWSSAYSPKPFFLAFYNNPLGEQIIKSMYAEQPSPRLDRLFGLAGVKWLVYPRYGFFVSYQDFQPTWQGAPVVDGFKNYKPVLDRTLAMQRGLEPVRRFETVDLYLNPLAAPSVMAATRVLAVADAAGQGGNTVAAVLPDLAGSDLYAPGQAVIPASDDPRFLEALGRVLGPEPGKAFLSDRSGKRQAFLYRGRELKTPGVEFRRLNDTSCVVRLTGLTGGFPLLFQETYHEGWKAYLMPRGEQGGPAPASLLGSYKPLADNEDDQATPAQLKEYVDAGLVTTLGDGREKSRELLTYGRGGKVDGRRGESFTVDFVSRREMGSIQNDNLPAPPLRAAWARGAFVPADPSGKGFDALAAASFTAEGAGDGLPLAWPEALHWQAGGFGNAWWIEPALFASLGGSAARYVRPNPAGGVDVELLIDFGPQRFYALGLMASGLTVALSLASLAVVGTLALLRQRSARG
jgi:hypothetical protein